MSDLMGELEKLDETIKANGGGGLSTLLENLASQFMGVPRTAPKPASGGPKPPASSQQTSAAHGTTGGDQMGRDQAAVEQQPQGSTPSSGLPPAKPQGRK